MKSKKYFSELLGTFVLTLVISLGLTSGIGMSLAVAAGLTLGLFVYTVGPISGAHLNPAVTLGLASVRKISPNDAIIYIVMQIFGALLAWALLPVLTGGVHVALPLEDTFLVGLAEAIGAFVLVWGVASVVMGKVSEEASGLVVGGSLTLGVLVASTLSHGILNPAVAVGVRAVNVTYLMAPLAGGVLAAFAYHYLIAKK